MNLEKLQQRQEALQKKLNSYQKGRNNEIICLGTAEELSELHEVKKKILSLKFKIKFKEVSLNRSQPTSLGGETYPWGYRPRVFKPIGCNLPYEEILTQEALNQFIKTTHAQKEIPYMKIINNIEDLDTKQIVFYHKDCPSKDGLVSAFAFALHNEWKDASFYPVDYAEDASAFLPHLEGKDIAVVDFSFNIDITRLMIFNCRSFLLLDHHESAMVLNQIIEERSSLPNIVTRWFIRDNKSVNIILNEKHSGTWLAWNYLHKAIPRVVQVINDYDLWKCRDLYQSSVIAGLGTLPETLDAKWLKLLADDSNLYDISTAGEHYLAIQDSIVKQAVNDWKAKKTFLRLHNTAGTLYMVPCINSAVYRNEIAESLGRQYTDPDFYKNNFVAVYKMVGDKVKISLRQVSTNTGCRTDCLNLLSPYNGGGHAKAAGFTIGLKGFSHILVDPENDAWLEEKIKAAKLDDDGLKRDYFNQWTSVDPSPTEFKPVEHEQNSETDNTKPKAKARGETECFVHMEEVPFVVAKPPQEIKPLRGATMDRDFHYADGAFLGCCDLDKPDGLGR